MVGRGVADGLGVVTAVRLGAGAVGLAFVAGGVFAATGEGMVAGGSVGVAEPPRVRRTRDRTATARPISRPYVAEKYALLGHPNVLPDRKTHHHAGLEPPGLAAIVTACALQGQFSSYVSVSAEQKLNHRRAPSTAIGSEGFLLARRPVVAGVTSTTESPQKTEI
jgi:hypothetical protein